MSMAGGNTHMIISFFGYSYLRLQGDTASIAFDPFVKTLGLKPSREKAEILALMTDQPDHGNTEVLSDVGLTILGPGEYEYRGILVHAIMLSEEAKKKKTAYVCKVDDLTICVLPPLSAELTDDQVDMIGDVDILALPVGGKDTLSAEKMGEIVAEIEPRVVIPTWYDVKGMTETGHPLKPFLDTVGGTIQQDGESKIKLKKSQLPQEEMSVIVLTPKGE